MGPGLGVNGWSWQSQESKAELENFEESPLKCQEPCDGSWGTEIANLSLRAILKMGMFEKFSGGYPGSTRVNSRRYCHQTSINVIKLESIVGST